MTGKRSENLLEECLAAYDAGLSPEECLSAFPEQRAELEPLFRQALSTRIAFSRLPDPEFRRLAKERFLFKAGRRASEALQVVPDPRFVERGRRRLLLAAGESAQEALRAVPPPRLPFWTNARRRFLEAAARPRQRPVLQPTVLALRLGISTAAIVFAFALAGLAYFAAQPSRSLGEEYAALERDWQQFELQRAGGAVPAEQFLELARRTNELLAKVEQPAAQPVVVEKARELVTRQKEVLEQASQAVPPGSAPPELKEAQQQIDQADDRVRALTASTPAAAVAAAPTSTPQPSPTQPPATATAPASAGTAAPTRTPAPTATSEPLQARQVLIALEPADTTYGMAWKRIRTADITFLVPADWQVLGLNVTSTGRAVLESGHIVMQDGSALIVTVNTKSGESQAIVNGRPVLLRTEGHDGDTVGSTELVENAGQFALELRHYVDSIDLLSEPPRPTPSATTTGTPATPSPTVTSGP